MLIKFCNRYFKKYKDIVDILENNKEDINKMTL